MIRRLLLLLAGLALAAPATAQMEIKGTVAAGRRLFHSPALSGNGFSCAHCHADFDEARRGDGLIRAGHSLWNAARRETWWGQDPNDAEAYTTAAEAAMPCVTRFMGNAEGLTAQQMYDLQAYLMGISPRGASSLAIAPAADKTGQYEGFDGGNRYSGRGLFYAACHSCHPNARTGLAPAIPTDRDPPYYARQIREGNGLGAVLAGTDPDAYDPGAGKYMPFFGADRLTAGQIRDAIAFIRHLGKAAAD